MRACASPRPARPAAGATTSRGSSASAASPSPPRRRPPSTPAPASPRRVSPPARWGLRQLRHCGGGNPGARAWGHPGELGDGGTSSQYSRCASAATGLPAVSEVSAGSAAPARSPRAAPSGAGGRLQRPARRRRHDGPLDPRPGEAPRPGWTVYERRPCRGQTAILALTNPASGGYPLLLGPERLEWDVGDGTQTNRSSPTTLSPTAIAGSVPGLPVILTASNDADRFRAAVLRRSQRRRTTRHGSGRPSSNRSLDDQRPVLRDEPAPRERHDGTARRQLQLRSRQFRQLRHLEQPHAAATRCDHRDHGRLQAQPQVPVSWDAGPGATGYELQWHAAGV